MRQSVVYWNDTLTITGENFGSSPRVIINRWDKSKYIANVSNTKLQLNADSERLNFKPGENVVLVIGSDGTGSSVFILKR